MQETSDLSRRDFLKASAAMGAGLALEFVWTGTAAAEAAASAPEVTAWIVIHPDDAVVIRVARSEMGQGSSTGLPMLVAEELECDWARVRTEFVSPGENLRRHRIYLSMATGGSRSIRDSNEYLRRAGAMARDMLIAAAARGWGVPASACRAEKGIITHGPSGRAVRYGEVAAAAAAIEPPRDVKLKDPKDWKLLGKRVPRLDIPDKVTGKSVFGIDVSLPGMLHAAIAQCPVFGGGVARLDGAAAERMRGVRKVVRLDDAVAVVADSWWRAQKAVDALRIEWDFAGNTKWSDASIRAFLQSGLTQASAPVASRRGDVAAAFAGGGKIVEADYYTPYLAHATMEPQTCTALVKGNRVEVWAPTQNAEATLAVAAKAAGVPLANAEVYKTQLGGGFGRRGGFQDYTRQAVLVAKALPGIPVKLLWTREQDIQHDHYRPAAMVRQRAALDGQGNLLAWQARIASHSILAALRPDAAKNGMDMQAMACYADMPYAVPAVHFDYAMRNTHVPVGFWRSVAHSQNPFFRECFLDEIAHAAGKDAYRMRRGLLGASPRYLGVLDACAKAAAWDRPLPQGVHRGIAVVDAYGSYAANVVELSVDAGKRIAIRRIVVAVDPGYVANRDSAEAQMESCVTYALTAAMLGEVTVKDGAIEQSNFNDYAMMLIRHMPRVEFALAPSGGFWGGMGEPPATPLTPALCNAIFAATGERVRTLPLKNLGYSFAA